MLSKLNVYSDSDIPEKRYDICKSCEKFKAFMCTECGCFMKVKVMLIHTKCPLDKWGPQDQFKESKEELSIK
jgi:hypothetical protein